MSKICNCDIYKKLTGGIAAESFNPPVGYNPISKIRNAMFLWVPVPFFGNPVWCKLKCLNMIELEACGNISMLYVGKKEDKNKKRTMSEIIELKDIYEKIARASLIYPAYDEIIKMIIDENFIISNKLEEIKSLKKLIKPLFNNKKKREVEEKIKQKELEIKFILPDDMTSFITCWALGVDVTDIQKLSRKMLFDAAILASNGKNNPHDHVSGIFTDLQKRDIDTQAWIIYNEFQEEKKYEKEMNKKGYQVFTKSKAV
jgi:hypothetical protein